MSGESYLLRLVDSGPVINSVHPHMTDAFHYITYHEPLVRPIRDAISSVQCKNRSINQPNVCHNSHLSLETYDEFFCRATCAFQEAFLSCGDTTFCIAYMSSSSKMVNQFANSYRVSIPISNCIEKYAILRCCIRDKNPKFSSAECG